MTFNPALPLKGPRHDIESEMGLATRTMAGVAFVPMGFVDDPQAFWIESGGQFLGDKFDPLHRPALAGASTVVNRSPPVDDLLAIALQLVCRLPLPAHIAP
jgi:hypothetical protein